MKVRSISVALLVSGFALAGLGSKSVPSESKIRSAIETFCKNPMSSRAKAASKELVEFALSSSSVTVLISPDFLPWMVEGKQTPHSDLLLAAYTAGNVRSQFDSGVKGNDAYSAIIQVFRVYRHIQEKEHSYRVPSVEHMLDLHRQGKLLMHIATLQEKLKEKNN